jgi:hypothetical protein
MAAPREKRLRLDTCPSCGSKDVVPIAYGYPGPEMVKDHLAGKIELGGCCLYEGMPVRACRACGHEWGGSQTSGGRR